MDVGANRRTPAWRQMEKSEPAIPYSVFLEQFVVAPTVRQIAATGRMI
jgi:hypothetical protein